MKRIISLLLALTIVAACLPLQSFAVENTTEFMGGDGTAGNPYLISNKRHLDNIRLYPSAHFLLVTDITFTERDDPWTPIDNFKGVIDGADHTINGLQITGICALAYKEEAVGFILQNSGKIRNLDFRGGAISISGYYISDNRYLNVGAVAAVNSGEVVNCTTDTAVTVDSTGSSEKSGFVIVGGVVGKSVNGRIDSCHNSGAVTAINKNIYGPYTQNFKCGGIVGTASNTEIINCGNTAPIYAKTKDTLYVGGIAGTAGGTIRACYNTGDIYGQVYQYEDFSSRASYLSCFCGGIVGSGNGSDCYNTGNIEGATRGDYDRAYFYGVGYGTCSNSYNVGQVTGTVDGKRSSLYIGAVGLEVENGYYLENVVTDTCKGVICTQDALQKEATFVGFDFEEVWSFDAFDTYAFPKLKWQIAAISSVYVLSKPEAPIVVTEGLEPELGNITVRIESADGRTKDVLLNLNMLPDLDIHTVGEQVVPVVYNGTQSDDTITVNVVEKRVAKIEMVSLPDKLNYFKDQEDLDLAGGQVKITYDNNTEETRALTEFHVTGFCGSCIGEQTLTVEYQGKTTQFDVVVYEIVSISMETLPNQLIYYHNEEDLSVAGGTVQIRYTNGRTDTIDLQSSMVSGFDKTALGRQTLTVTYHGYETRYDVYVYCVSSIGINKRPSKMEYVQGQPLQLGDGTIWVHYTEGRAADTLSLEQASVSYDPNQVGEVNVTVNYKGQETVLNIRVLSKVIASVKDFVEPQKLSYYQGESLDLTGGSLYVTYVSEDGYSETIPLAEGMISGYDKNSAGYQTLTVSYHDFNQTFIVRVIEKKITGIQIDTLPDKLIYGYQNSLDVTGGSVCVIYNSGESETIVLTEEMVSGFNSAEAGVQSLTVTYAGQTCTYEVAVITESYTVVFRDWDGREISTGKYYYGEEVMIPADPAKAADDTYIYSFAGWDKEVVNCAGNATYTATYTSQKHVVIVKVAGEQYGFPTFNDAVKEAPAGSAVQLWRDIEEDVIISKSFVLDLNGFDVIGNITVTPEAELSVKDSQTDDYTIEDSNGYGKIVGTIGSVQAENGYIMITKPDGVSFHRIDLQMTDMTLRASAVGVYYKCNFAGDEVVAQHVDRYGVALSIAGVPAVDALGVCSWYDSFTPGNGGNAANGTLLHGVMKTTNAESVNSENAEMDIYGRAYILTKDGQYIFGECHSRSFREQVELVDTQWNELTTEQQFAVLDMHQSYKSIMDKWDIPNILATE